MRVRTSNKEIFGGLREHQEGVPNPLDCTSHGLRLVADG